MTLTLDRAHQLLICDPQQGKLWWIRNDQRPDLVGLEAGWAGKDYRCVSIDGNTYYVAQIVWLFVHGELCEYTLDHADGNHRNDCIDNLRPATKGQNSANSKMNCRNTSGYKGVSFCYITRRWRASIKTHGLSRNLGRFDTPEEAHQAWLAAAEEAWGPEFVRVA